jgi:GNAT superfamily N-acetyltransferase
MIRQFSEHDLGALLKCWNESAAYDALPAEVLEEKLTDEGAGGVTGWLWEESSGGSIDCVAGFIAGAVGSFSDADQRGYVKMLAVRPAARRRGIGAALLDRMLDVLQAEGARTVRIGESAPNYLTPGLDRRYADSLIFFCNRRFEVIGEAVDMEAPLGDFRGHPDPGVVDCGHGYVLRRAGEAKIDALNAFLAEHWPAWLSEVGSSMRRQPPAVHVADRGSEIVAFAAHSGNNAGLGTFGPMGTAPAHRGHGLGARLFERCLVDLARKGFVRAVIPWVGPVAFYERTVAASISRTFVRLERRL